MSSRPAIDEDIIEQLTERANDVSKIPAENLSVQDRIHTVLATIEQVDDEDSPWYDTK